MGIFQRIRNLIGGRSRADDDQLHTSLAGFDGYSQTMIGAVDRHWDASTRMRSVEYFAFLYGAALAIVRGNGRKDAYAVAILGPFLSRFMDSELSVRWLLEREAELVKSRRLQGVQAAGCNTAQAVLLAGSQGRAGELNRPQNMRLLSQVFSEVRKLMEDKTATDERLFAASGQLYDSVVGK